MGHPVFEVTQNYDAAKKQLILNVKQTQKIDPNNEFPQVEFFQTFVNIEIDNQIERVWIKPQAENVFTSPLASQPMLVNFDYEGTLIKELKFNKSIDELVYQMMNDRDVLGRRWAIGELSKIARDQKTSVTDKEKVMSALRGLATSDKSWQIRRAAFSEIRQIVIPQAIPGTAPVAVKLDDATVQILLNAAKDGKSLIRAEAIGVLSTTRDAKFADLYLSALNDRSYAVIDNAAVALGNTKNAKAYDSLVRLLNQPSWKSRVQIAGLNGLAALDDKRGLELGFKYAGDKTLPSNVRSAALSVVATSGKSDARAFPLIFDAFKKSLANNEFQNIFSGIQAIVKLADPRGQEAFDLMKAKFKNQPNYTGFIDFFEKQFQAAVKK